MQIELQELQNRFRAEKSLKVDARGLGKTSFLYVRSTNRAVEISMDNPGVFVEYWDVADETSDRDSVKSEIMPSTAEVFEKVMRWLWE